MGKGWRRARQEYVLLRMKFQVQGIMSNVQGSRFKVQGSRFQVQGFMSNVGPGEVADCLEQWGERIMFGAHEAAGGQ